MLTESELIAQAKQGDFEAFETLVTRHERRLYRLVVQLVHKAEDAEDIIQTAFLNALEHLGGFREESSFGTWLTRIATHEALKVLRRRNGWVQLPAEEGTEVEDGDIPHPEYIADWRENPAEMYEQRLLRVILDEAIQQLPDSHRLVFVLRDVEGFSIEETAQVLSISPANVKVRLLRARLALREKLTTVFGDETRRHQRTPDHGGDSETVTKAARLLEHYQAQINQRGGA
ncbi:MAG: sigma-70 family RNA polymerase sigma factor [Blastocatellia bacterium]|nr:sigma-70 family RNA polymerase sigma factor [Blastocatellia bacterium]